MSSILIRPSPAFLNILKELSVISGVPKNIRSICEKELCDSFLLNTSDIKWCHTKIKEQGLPYRIHSLLNESSIIIPKHEPPPRSPELEARIQRLKAEQSNREYREMTKNVYVNQYEAASLQGVGKEMREMNRQLVTGLQYLVSIVGTFFAIFVGLSFASVDYGPRVLLATFGAIAVAIAEIYFIIKQDIAEEESFTKKLNITKNSKDKKIQ